MKGNLKQRRIENRWSLKIIAYTNGGISLQVRFSQKGSILIAKLSGELDHHSADYLRMKIDCEITKSTTKSLLLDFSDVGFMDSSGLGVIMGRYKNMRSMNGKTAVVSVNSQIRKLLEMAGIGKIVPIYEEKDKAMQELA
jgi:stage II sporulation protein AA (anti-sigma F factor antagonist)